MENIYLFCMMHEDGTSETICAKVFVYIDTWTFFEVQQFISYLTNWDSKKICDVYPTTIENIGRSCIVRIDIHTDKNEVELSITDENTNEKIFHETKKARGEKIERLGNQITIILPQSDDYAY